MNDLLQVVHAENWESCDVNDTTQELPRSHQGPKEWTERTFSPNNEASITRKSSRKLSRDESFRDAPDKRKEEEAQKGQEGSRSLDCRLFSIGTAGNFKIDEELWNAMFTPGLLDKLQAVVSTERIQNEVKKMMKHNTVESLRLFNRIDQNEPRLLEIMFGGEMWLTPTMKNK